LESKIVDIVILIYIRKEGYHRSKLLKIFREAMNS
jgi:hypothetical protein